MRRERLLELQRRVGDNARALRESRGLTQAHVAEALGVDDRYLRRLEAGAFNLSLESLLKLSTAYRVDPKDLLRPRRKPLAKAPPGRPARASGPPRRARRPR